MARPKHDDPFLFTRSEVAEATGLAPGNVGMLRENGLGPFARRDQAGGKYGEDTLAEIAMIAACAGAGYQLNLSAALVDAFVNEHPSHPPARFCLLDEIDRSIARKGQSWFHRYTIMRRVRETAPQLLEAQDQDAVLVIADRQFVCTWRRGPPRLGTLSPPGVDPKGPQALGVFEDLRRGGDPAFTALSEIVGPMLGTDIGAATMDAALAAYQTAVRNAVALATINLSLAIRTAFDRVFDMRIIKGGPLWPDGAA